MMVWIAGSPGFDFPPNVGHPVNGDYSTDRYALMEVHFDNFPQKAKMTRKNDVLSYFFRIQIYKRLGKSQKLRRSGR